jgi:ABC-type transport system substrate-binding protein
MGYPARARRWSFVWPGLIIALSALFIVACGAPADDPTPPPAATTAPGDPTPTPVAEVEPTTPPNGTTPAGDAIRVVINDEFPIPDVWQATTLYHNQAAHNIVQPLAFFDPDFEDTVTAGFQSYEIIDNHRWRIHLTEGMQFHNGEPWNAETAKYTIDVLGSRSELPAYSNIGQAHAEIIDEYTLDWVCQDPCPMLPRYVQYHVFQAPDWYENTTEEARAASGDVIGWGPYKLKEWRRGDRYIIELNEDYIDPGDRWIAQAGTIREATYVWRPEALVRSAMIQTGEAHLAWSMPGDMRDELDNSPQGKAVDLISAEFYSANVDQIWHPELRKLEVRQAMAHAIDCEGIALALFGPSSRCGSGPNADVATLGVTEENARPIYEYDPVRARELLAQANYDPSNQIPFFTRAGRWPKDTEVAEALGGFWNEVGLNVSINIVENSVWNDRHLTGPARIIDRLMNEEGMTFEEAVAQLPNEPPPPPANAPPGLIFFAPGGELFDFGRQLAFYAVCDSPRSKNCTVERHNLANAALSASGDERRRLMEEAYEEWTTNLVHISMMEIIAVWGVNRNIEFVNQPGGRRILVNTMRWIQ